MTQPKNPDRPGRPDRPSRPGKGLGQRIGELIDIILGRKR